MNRCRISVVAALTTVAALLAVVPSAGASFHLMQIRAVFLGPADASFVELQMYADGQNFVSGHAVVIYNSAGTPTISYPLMQNVPNGQNQRTVLLADTSQPTTPDFLVNSLHASLDAVKTGGALCFDNIDCVSWGGFTGNANLPSSAGAPIVGNLSTSQVSARNITRGCATALDPADDTNSAAADFGFAVGFPVRANATAPTETLCPSTGTPGKKKRKRKCKKKPSKNIAASAKKKKCKKKK